jgi:hypothetical protein
LDIKEDKGLIEQEPNYKLINETVSSEIQKASHPLSSLDSLNPKDLDLAWEKVTNYARLGFLLHIASNPNQDISPVDNFVPPDEAMQTIKHLCYLGAKPWFNAQRIHDCIVSVEAILNEYSRQNKDAQAEDLS